MKIVISPYISRESSEFHEIWYADKNFDPDDGNVTKKSKISKCKMADRRRIENQFWAMLSKCLMTKIQYGGRQHFEIRYLRI